MPQTLAIATHAGHGKSWMAPNTSSEDLLYVSDNDDGDVYVFTYPQGQLVGTLSPNTYASGECSDPAGDVFVTTNDANSVGTIYEYAHGGTEPIAALSDPGWAVGCAFDATTGNLAVANLYNYGSPYSDTVGVYVGAKGEPKIYSLQSNRYVGFQFCGYDTHGKLYLPVYDEYAEHYTLAELEPRSGSFKVLDLNTSLEGGGNEQPSVQWDGQHMAVSSFSGPWKAELVYRLRISGDKATVIGTTRLVEVHKHHGGQLWIQGDKIVGIDQEPLNSISIWRYPKGGRPTKRIEETTRELWGVTVSAASSG
jgi:hypothetical protein